jgi:hypothetical protein
MERNWWVEQAERLRRQPRVFTDVATPNLSVPRSMFIATGGFAPMYPREDWEFGYRLMSAGVPVRPVADAAVIHDLSIEPPRELDDRRREGIADVHFAQRHPRAYWTLPLVAWKTMSRRRRRAVRMLLHARMRSQTRGITRFVVLLLRWGQVLQRLLERAGVEKRAMNLLRDLSFVSYWTGVAGAVGSWAAWSHLVERASADPGPSSALDLAAPWWDGVVSGAASNVIISFAGAPLGGAPLYWGGIPWDAEAFARRVIDRFGPNALVAEMSR